MQTGIITKVSILSGLLTVVVTGFLVGSENAYAAKVDKWVDENGTVTYRDRPPEADVAENLEVKDIDSQNNVIEYANTPVDPNSRKSDESSAEEFPSSLKNGKLSTWNLTEEDTKALADYYQEITLKGKYTKDEMKQLADELNDIVKNKKLTREDYLRRWMPLIEAGRNHW